MRSSDGSNNKLTVMKKILFLSLILIILQSCVPTDTPVPDSVEGLRPIYAEGQDWQQVFAKPVQPITKLGKMYYKDPFLYVVEQNRGFHVFDNTNPADPTPIGFVEIFGCNEYVL